MNRPCKTEENSGEKRKQKKVLLGGGHQVRIFHKNRVSCGMRINGPSESKLPFRQPPPSVMPRRSFIFAEKCPMNALEQLKRYTRVVADTGDFESILSYRPVDATTNPSLITAAARQGKYRPLVDEAIREARADAVSEALLIGHCLDTISVAFGKEILKIVPGRVSTEVDARLSFDREATVGKARKLVEMYERKGIERERILIKVAATWEGICAARQLENEGIHCKIGRAHV